MGIGVGTSSAQTPLNRNFGGMKKYVAAYVQGAQLTSVLADAGAAINGAVDFVNMNRWKFLHKSDTITLTADTASYTTPADLKRPLKLYRLNGSSERQGQIDFREQDVFFDELHAQTGSGFPTYYTIPSAGVRTLLLDRAPSSDFVTQYPTLELRYYARLQNFSDDGDTIGDLNAPPELWSFLAWYARWDLASVRAPRQADAAERHWKTMFTRLRADDLDTLTDWDL